MGLRSSSSKCLCMVGALELLCVISVMHGALAQSDNCTNAVEPLLVCVPYIEVAGNTSIPPSSCCTPLRSFFASSDPTCLCQIADIAQKSSVSINETRALDVAALCNQTVPASVVSCFSSGASTPLGAPSTTSPPPQRGSESPNLGSDLLPPSLLLIGSILLALFLHLGVIST